MALWTPAEIATALWLDANDADTIDLVSGKVSAWRDKSGNSVNFSQTTDTSRPTLDADAVNGRAAVDFSAGYRFLSASIGLEVTDNLSFFIVFSRPSAGGYSFSLTGSVANGFPYGLFWQSTNQRYSGFSASTNAVHGSTSAATGWFSWSYTRAGAGNTCKLYEHGTLVGSEQNGGEVATPAAYCMELGRWGGGSTYTGGAIAEIVAIADTASDEDRQKIEGYLAWRYGLEASLPSGHPYKDAAPTLPNAIIEVVLEQDYNIEPNETIEVVLEQAYSIEFAYMQKVLSQRYGDVPVMSPVLLQPYGDTPWLTRQLEQRWGDAVGMEISLAQPWMMPETLLAICLQPYGIAAEVLHTDLSQPYHLNPYDVLTTDLAQPYAIAAESPRLRRLDTLLYVDGERFPYFSLEWQATESEYAWYCAFSTKSRAAALRCVESAAIRIEHMGESYHFKCYGGWMLDRRHADDVYRIEGWSRTRDLDTAQPLTGDIAGGMASSIVTDLAADHGIEIVWQMVDGYIASGKLSAMGETPLTIIGRIVHDAGGILQSTPDGKLLVVAAEEVAIPEYPTAPVAAVINARLERISTSEQADEQQGYNRIEVSDQTAVAGQRSLEYVEIDSRTREVRLFVVPLAGRSFALLHSGGPLVSIEPYGVATLPVDDEQVEIVAGSGRTTKPVYANRGVSWLRDDLGAIAWGEDGVLTAATPDGYSLLKISYDSRYVKWICRSDDIADVQFRAVEITTS